MGHIAHINNIMTKITRFNSPMGHIAHLNNNALSLGLTTVTKPRSLIPKKHYFININFDSKSLFSKIFFFLYDLHLFLYFKIFTIFCVLFKPKGGRH